ncbi:MAG: phosphatidylserine/phosphatidylglycerophosphate/cardiolipin synthase family protein [Candidatus Sericytochromatia bacterium]
MKDISKKFVSLLAVSVITLSCSRADNSMLLAPEQESAPVVSKDEVNTFAAETASKIFSETDKSNPEFLTQEQAKLDKNEMKVLDKDNDGKITKSEVADNVKQEFDKAAKIAQQVQTPNLLAAQYEGEIPNKPAPSTFKTNKVQLFIDREEILPMMMDVIKKAQKSIQMDLFLLGGNIGLEIAEELNKKKKEGVDIKLTFDPNLGFSGTTRNEVMKVVEYLRKNNMDFRVYPLHLMPIVDDGLLKNKFQIDHNKITVIDQKTFIIGGFNLFDIGVVNRDLMLKIEGDTAKEASDLLTYEWILSDKYVPEKVPSKYVYVVKALKDDPGADAQVKIVKTAPNESSTKEALISMIDSAKTSVYLAVLEFSDMDVTNALIRAHKRGVEVKVLMDRKNTNDKYAGGIPVPSYYPNMMPAVELVKNNVPVRWYDPRFAGQELHMKMCVTDSNKLLAGSTNFTRQAFTTFRETSVVVDGGTAPNKMVRTFIEDWTSHATAIKKVSLKDKISAKVIGFLDKKYYAWW